MRVLLQRLLDEADARQLPALIAEWSEREDALRWVAIALQLDLPLLIERPELVVPCVVRRCGMFDSVETYANRTVPGDAADVRALVDDWVAAWDAPGAWLQAVRPPAYPLEAGIVEEYRTSVRGPLRFSADDRIIGIVGTDGVVAWERATGRRVDAHLAVEEPRWGIRYGTNLMVARDGREVALGIREEAHSVFELDEGTAIVACRYEADPYEDGYEHASYLVETASGRCVWRMQGSCHGARRVGDRIVIVGYDHVAMVDARTGAEVSRHGVSFAPTSALSSGGLFATCDGDVVRVWDLARVAERVPRSRIQGDVALSPDGTRAVIGRHLIDAHSGKAIEELSLRGTGGWLEGGPAAKFFGLVDGFVIEVMPHGTRMWGTEYGDLRHVDIKAQHGDAIGYDPRGRYLAVFYRRRNQLCLYGLPGGRRRFETPANVIERRDGHELGFSAEGDQLWWETAGGEWWVIETANPVPRRLEGEPPAPHEPTTIECRDGLLVVGDAAVPVDGPSVVVTDRGRSFLTGNDHYRLRERTVYVALP